MQFFYFLLLIVISIGNCWSKTVDVAIIGGGLSGLATAYELKKNNLSYLILELAPRVGGRVRTVSYRLPEEVAIDSGMEEYWESNPAVSILKELKLPLLHDVAISSIVLNGKLHPLSGNTTEEYFKRIFNSEEYLAFSKFKNKITPLVEDLKQAHLQFKPIPNLELKDTAFSTWVLNQKLPKKVSEWIRVSIECEIGTSWDRISALDGLAEFHIFLGKGEESYRVVGGNQKFTEAFSRAVGTSHIWLNKRVSRVVYDKNKNLSNVFYLDLTTNQNGVVTAKHVVNTVPLFRALFEIQFDPPISERKKQAIQTQTWGSYFKAHVFLNKSAERFWKTDDQSILPILSDSVLGVVYDGNADSSLNTRVLSLLIWGNHAEQFNLSPLENARENITKGFEKLWPGFSKEIKGMEFYRFHPRAIAAWPVGRSRFDALSNEVRKPENQVYFAGDFTESSHSDGAFISARRVVQQILATKNAAVTAAHTLKAANQYAPSYKKGFAHE